MLYASGIVSDGLNELINSARVSWNMRVSPWEFLNVRFILARGISRLWVVMSCSKAPFQQGLNSRVQGTSANAFIPVFPFEIARFREFPAWQGWLVVDPLIWSWGAPSPGSLLLNGLYQQRVLKRDSRPLHCPPLPIQVNTKINKFPHLVVFFTSTLMSYDISYVSVISFPIICCLALSAIDSVV